MVGCAGFGGVLAPGGGVEDEVVIGCGEAEFEGQGDGGEDDLVV